MPLLLSVQLPEHVRPDVDQTNELKLMLIYITCHAESSPNYTTVLLQAQQCALLQFVHVLERDRFVTLHALFMYRSQLCGNAV